MRLVHIQAYHCCFEDCDDGLPLFSTLHEWLVFLAYVEIRRTSRNLSYSHSYDVQYLLAYAALSSIVSLEGYELDGNSLDDHYEGSPDELYEEFYSEFFGPESEDYTIESEFEEDAIDLVPQTSSLQHLKLEGCVFRQIQKPSFRDSRTHFRRMSESWETMDY